MSVFVCAADESADQNPRGNFVYGGFAAPLETWEGHFASAWNERVLEGPPQIPYLHVTDLYSLKWREQHGISGTDADQRLDEASRVIRSTGRLIPLVWHVSERDYNSIVRRPFRRDMKSREQTLDPDYLLFMFFACAQLQWIHAAYPDVEKVDFWVERNGKITRQIQRFHEHMAANLTHRPELGRLVGELLPVGKERIPAQAADMLVWHERKAIKGRLSSVESRRYWRMIEGGTGRFSDHRYGHSGVVDLAFLRDLGDAFTLAEERAASAESA